MNEVEPIKEWRQAKSINIARVKSRVLDSCWSACNGTDGFGNFENDVELNKVRRRYGETMSSLPLNPYLILFRERKASPLMMKIWFTYHLDEDLDPARVLMNLAKACLLAPSHYMDVDLFDWAHTNPRGEFADGRYELSIEFIGRVGEINQLRLAYKRFCKHLLNDKSWK